MQFQQVLPFTAQSPALIKRRTHGNHNKFYADVTITEKNSSDDSAHEVELSRNAFDIIRDASAEKLPVRKMQNRTVYG